MAWKIKCYISKSKLIICEYNAYYFSEIAFIDFTLHEIKQGIVFLGTPGIYIYIEGFFLVVFRRVYTKPGKQKILLDRGWDSNPRPSHF